MSRQRMIDTAFWTDPYIQLLDPSEKLVFLYLLSNPQANICGVYEITDRQTAFDTGFSIEVVRVCFQRFERDGRLMRAGNWVAFRNWIKHQAKAPGVQEGIRKQLAEVPPELADYARGSTPVQPGLTPVEPTLDLTQLNGEGDQNQAAPPQAAPDPGGEEPHLAVAMDGLEEAHRDIRAQTLPLDRGIRDTVTRLLEEHSPDAIITAFRRALKREPPEKRAYRVLQDMTVRVERPQKPQPAQACTACGAVLVSGSCLRCGARDAERATADDLAELEVGR